MVIGWKLSGKRVANRWQKGGDSVVKGGVIGWKFSGKRVVNMGNFINFCKFLNEVVKTQRKLNKNTIYL